MSNIKSWIVAFRLRTLPLSLSCIGMGGFLAYFRGLFDWQIFALSFLTTIFLQILSNLANDYGDTVFGADNVHREGPDRMVQAGNITLAQMKKMIFFFIVLSFVLGIILLYLSNLTLTGFIVFLILGILAIIAAVNYTIGMKKPYGYKGFGDISVYVFFGLLAVLGSYYLYAGSLDIQLVLPASTCGFFATAVLNINNMRDIESDRIAGKHSIAGRLGLKKALIYHAVLLFGGVLLAVIFVVLNYKTPFQFIFLLSLPLFIKNYLGVKNAVSSSQMDPYLKQMAISTLIFVLLFGIGLML